VSEHSPTPWAYRSQEGDDWGFIRTTVANDAGWHPVVAVARYVGNPTDADLGEHRRNKTDPSFGNAEMIVRSVNNHDALVDAAREALRALESAKAFIAEKQGTANRHRNDTIKQLRAVLDVLTNSEGGGE